MQNGTCPNPAPTPAQAPAPTTQPTDTASLALVLDALDLFKNRFDCLEENMQAINEVLEIDGSPNDNSNDESFPYLHLHSCTDVDCTNVIDKCCCTHLQFH